MPVKIIPEFDILLTAVEKRYGHRISTSSDYESLSSDMEAVTGEYLSASTLKRMWGYVSLRPNPRLTTLDILSQYIGEKDFRHFCENQKKGWTDESGFFSANCVAASNLKKGDIVTIRWKPGRLVTLNHLEGSEFEVISSINSKMLKGDRFHSSEFIIGNPLYIAGIMRDGELTAPFIAGKDHGLSHIEVQSKHKADSEA